MVFLLHEAAIDQKLTAWLAFDQSLYKPEGRWMKRQMAATEGSEHWLEPRRLSGEALKAVTYHAQMQ